MDADLDLGRALVAAPGWVWRAGMLALMPAEGRHPACTCRIVGDAPFPGISGYTGRLGLVGLDLSAIPDLSDDATAGVLVGMLREAVPGWTVEILMLRAHVEVCVGSPGSGGRTVHVDTSLGRAAARAWLSTKERA